MLDRDSSRDPIAAYARASQAVRRVGVGARCACGQNCAQALMKQSTPMICARCQRKSAGKTVMERHHIAGKANSNITISIPVNDHRGRLSVDQAEWLVETLRNPDRCPLTAIAACMRGFGNTVRYLIDALLIGPAEFLEEVSRYLRRRLGPKWWEDPALNIPNGRQTNAD